VTIHEAREERFGRYFEEFVVGDVYRHWPGQTITEAEDHLFCMLTRAASPVHVDRHYAETEMEGGRNLVVGTFIYAILLGMSVPDTSGKAIAALGTESLRHIAPLYHGDTLYGETTVLDKTESKSKDDRGVVYVETIGYNQDGKVVCIFRRKVMVPKNNYLELRGGEQPARPVPQPDKNWPGDAPAPETTAE
jgi:acyl dehydratase